VCGFSGTLPARTILLDISHGESYIERTMGDTRIRVIRKKKCLRCGHEWWPRIAGQPVRCSGCRTPYWAILPGRDGRRAEGR